jgi:hypothetical protein
MYKMALIQVVLDTEHNLDSAWTSDIDAMIRVKLLKDKMNLVDIFMPCRISIDLDNKDLLRGDI